MLGWTAMFLQAATLPDAAPAAPPARTSVLPPPCPSDANGDIVVCGRVDAQETYRLRALPERFVKDPRFRINLPGGSTITPHIDQGRLGDAQAKVTLKVPF
ncbi:hypothetical protein [Sphingomonas sp. BAUL-RG-20F-R05-02]|uniref:hypothetical protein n=1 Tax=Sphingomonas sp. BAUL-RG-20F-R05-02 TaxID=2914830 RepID=UPI001F599440|nr:hypothetical protein [Sphingomonas sp. BAUL-RG-20F-R05-02]